MEAGKTLLPLLVTFTHAYVEVWGTSNSRVVEAMVVVMMMMMRKMVMIMDFFHSHQHLTSFSTIASSK